VLAQAAFDRANTDVTNINLGINTLLGDSEGKTVPYFTVMANGRVSTVGMAVNTQLFANTGQITTNTSFGRIQVGLAPIANSVAGTYTAANLQVDQYGRVVSVSSNTSIATGLANAIRTYNYAGTLTVNLGSKRLYITNPAAIVSIQFNLVTAGTTATSIAVKKNGIVINNTTLNAGISNLTTTPYIPVTTNDYLTIDIEGGELEILSQLDFSRWRFKVLTYEHNSHLVDHENYPELVKRREKMEELLYANGYVLYKNYEGDGFFISSELVD
jgi:hypothetical protein